MLEARAAKYVMFDVTWCGGLSEAKKISTMAEAFELPVAPHTAGGPLLFYATTHLTTALTNLAIQESCQVFYENTWPTMLDNPMVPQNGKSARRSCRAWEWRSSPRYGPIPRRSLGLQPRSVHSDPMTKSRLFVGQGRLLIVPPISRRPAGTTGSKGELSVAQEMYNYCVRPSCHVGRRVSGPMRATLCSRRKFLGAMGATAGVLLARPVLIPGPPCSGRPGGRGNVS